MILIKNDMIQ